MIYTPILYQAIDLALSAHDGQVRKGKTTPYVVHVMTVALLLSRVSDDEEVIVAGILHDTVEDSKPPHKITIADIEHRFGKRVARMVFDVSEKGDKTRPWLERKREALEHIAAMEHDSQLVKSADLLQNLTESIEDWKLAGVAMFEKFNASKEDVLWRYSAVLSSLEKAWSDNPLLPDLKDKVQFIQKNWK
jgi:(p)ppGpp synthase/HD superfamily hydrolase